METKLATLRVAFLGDSYTGGGYQPWTRNERWPTFFDLPGHRIEPALLARPGARTQNIGWYEGDTIVGTPQTRRHQNPALQLEQLAPGTGLVTVTIGGNDAEYINVLLGASLVPVPGWTKPLERIDELAARTQPKLVRVYQAIRRRAGEEACVVAIGYPTPFPPGGVESRWVSTWFSPLGQRLVRYANEQLRQANRAAAAAAGVHFLDPTDAFAEHGVCAPAEWIRGVVVHAIPGITPMPFHPTADGHRAIARLLQSYLTGFPPDWPRTADGMPANPLATH